MTILARAPDHRARRPAPWIQTTGDDGATYVSADETSGETLELDIDDQGHLARIARSQPPFGIEVDEPFRVGAETVFSEFDIDRRRAPVRPSAGVEVGVCRPDRPALEH